MTDRILRCKDVVATLGISRSTVYRMIDRDEFPKPFQISRHTVGWRTSVVEQWLEERSKAA